MGCPYIYIYIYVGSNCPTNPSKDFTEMIRMTFGVEVANAAGLKFSKHRKNPNVEKTHRT